MVDGTLGKKNVGYHVQFIYKTNMRSPTDDHVYLQDAYLFFPVKAVRLKVGQFIPPFGMERFEPDSSLDFVDRTDVTNRLAVNGNLGKSFARDLGLQGDWSHGNWLVSMGLFGGGGANMNRRRNGPLEVGRMRYQRSSTKSRRPWSWEGGIAASSRRAENLNLTAQLPGLPSSLLAKFSGQDRRGNLFVRGSWGRVRGQAEYFRVWLSSNHSAPSHSAEVAAQGAYAQLAYLPFSRLILAVRTEWFTPNVHQRYLSSQRTWTFAATYDLKRLPLRIATDFSHRQAGLGVPEENIWRLQLQYWLFRHCPHRCNAGRPGAAAK